MVGEKAFLPVTLLLVDTGVQVVTWLFIRNIECYWISIGYLHGQPRINMWYLCTWWYFGYMLVGQR